MQMGVDGGVLGLDAFGPKRDETPTQTSAGMLARLNDGDV